MSERQVPPSEVAAAAEGPIHIQATPPAAEVKKEARDKAHKPLTPERLARDIAPLDRAMVVVLLLLAFFLASFAAQNSDIWMHLATGRLIAQGQHTFGVDPFSCNVHGTSWINHAWLTDWLAYVSTQLLGGPETAAGGGLLVVVKAVMITLLIGVMLSIRPPHPTRHPRCSPGGRGKGEGEQSLWAPVVSVALAALAMSPRLLLQPTCISYLFMGITLWLLVKGTSGDDQTQKLYALPLLFALWVNLDSWFILGPLLVLLFLLGEFLQDKLAPILAGQDAPPPGITQRLALVLVLGLAACLLNPHHVRAFDLPPDLALFWSSTPLRDEAGFAQIFLSPIDGEYLTVPARGKNIAGFSYVVLVLLGLASFLLNARNWRGWRVTAWSTFFLLSAFWARSVPLFAVVAGPIAALNLQDFAARRFGLEPRSDRAWRNWSLIGRGVTLFVLLGLVVLAWPGWLHDYTSASHRVGWRVNVDPSLKQAADKLRSLHQQGAVRANAFNNTPEIANYLAWFCPEEKTFFDYRTQLFDAEATQQYLDLCQALAPRRRAGGDVDQSTWQAALRDSRRPIDHIILSGSDYLATVRNVEQLWNRSDQWTMLYMDGRTTIFGWTDPRGQKQEDRWQRYRYDSAARAFAQGLEEDARVPEQGTEPPLPTDLYDRFLKGPGARPLGLDESMMQMRYFFHTGRRQQLTLEVSLATAWEMFAHTRALGIRSAGGLALPAAMESIFQGPVLFGTMRNIMQGTEFGSPAALILAVRAARRAVAANPDDADSYIALANAYSLISKQSLEARTGQDRRLDNLRHMQLVNLLNFTLSLKPDSLDAYDLLYQIYEQNDYRRTPYLDLAVDNLKKWLELMPGSPRGQDEQFRELVQSRRETLKRMETLLKSRREDFLLKSDKASMREKLRLARGLWGQEAELWKEAISLPDALNRAEASRCIEVLLMTGNYVFLASHPQAQDLLQRAEMASWFLIVMAAVRGDYNLADQNLEALLGTIDSNLLGYMLHAARRHLVQADPQTLFQVPSLVGSLVDRANLLVVRGVLALEAGDMTAADKHFRAALDIRRSPIHYAGLLACLAAGSPVELVNVQGSAVLTGTFTPFQFDYALIAARYLHLLEQEQAKRRAARPEGP